MDSRQEGRWRRGTVGLLAEELVCPGVVRTATYATVRSNDDSALYQAASRLRSIQAVFSWICMR